MNIDTDSMGTRNLLAQRDIQMHPVRSDNSQRVMAFHFKLSCLQNVSEKKNSVTGTEGTHYLRLSENSA